ncbi:MAG: hypothetical protein WC309_03150 [Candidatus Paceibacterota bacterium]|jgi:hypothetical protein
MDDVRSRAQAIISRIAQREANTCNTCGYGGGAIVVLMNPDQKTGIERKRALARGIILGKTPLVHLVRFLDEALEAALKPNQLFVQTKSGNFFVGVAGFSAERNTYIARNVLRLLSLHYVGRP